MNSEHHPPAESPGATGSGIWFVLVWIVMLLIVLAQGYLSLLSVLLMGSQELIVVVWNLLCFAVLVFALVQAMRLHRRRGRGEAVAASQVWLYVLGVPLLTLFVWVGGCALSNPSLHG